MSNLFGHSGGHSHIAVKDPPKEKETKETKAAKAGEPTIVETITPEKPDKPEKEPKEKKAKLGTIDTNRLIEELRGVVDDKGTTPNNPAARFVFGELANAIERSFQPKPEEKEPADEEDDEPPAKKK